MLTLAVLYTKNYSENLRQLAIRYIETNEWEREGETERNKERNVRGSTQRHRNRRSRETNSQQQLIQTNLMASVIA